MPNEPENRSSRTRNIAILATILIACGAFILGLSLRTGSAATNSIGAAVGDSQAWPTVPPTFTPFAKAQNEPPPPTATPLPPPDWSELGYLTSVRFNVSTIVTEQRQQLLGIDRLIIMVVGDVLMGIDLTQIKEEDVLIEGRKISLTLPAASISSIELRLDKSQIYDSTSAWIWSDYTGLEKNAFERAQRQLYEQSAADPNMLQTTELLAKLQLSEFLQKVGFKTVDISFKKGDSRWDD